MGMQQSRFGLHRLAGVQWVALLAMAMAAMACLPGRADAKRAKLSVSDGNPNFSADQINAGQSTTARFIATPEHGSPDAKGEPIPTIIGETFSVTVDKFTKIGGISGLPAGTGVHVSRPTTDSSGDTTESFRLTGTKPESAFNIFIGVTCSKASPTGTSHPVTLSPKSIITSENGGVGEAGTCAGSGTESCKVRKLAVNMSGPPYVIIDNAPPAWVSNTKAPPEHGHYAPPANRYSTYTVYATGGSGDYKWRWSEGPGIALKEGEYNTSNHIDVYGVSSTGKSVISCVVTDLGTGATAASEIGYRHPCVEKKYVTMWTRETLGAADAPPTYGATVLKQHPVYAPAGAGQSVKVTTHTVVRLRFKVGTTVSGNIPASDLGLHVGLSTVTHKYNVTSSAIVSCPASASATYWAAATVPMVFTLYGTGYQYGPNGVAYQHAITMKRHADPLADALNLDNQTWAATPMTVNVTPVSP